MYQVYGDMQSGNCYKIKLLLQLLEIEHKWHHVDILEGDAQIPDSRLDEYKAKQEGGHKALSVMEEQLSRSSFLVGDSLTIADISLFAYTHVAHEGGFDLEGYPNILNWINRIQALPHFVTMSQENV